MATKRTGRPPFKAKTRGVRGARRVGTGAAAAVSSVGRQVRELRKVKGMTLAELGALIGRSVGYVSQIERDISALSLVDLRAISVALGIPITWFFQGDDAVDDGG